MQTATDRSIAALLSQTGAAHGEYEERAHGGKYDEDWPQWYAAYLIEHGVNDLIGGSALTVEQLSALLKQLDEDYRREKPADGWPVYYARRIAAMNG